ncbi:MAG: hypothetical protein ACRD5R_00185, partial [Candidatus Acidiferrales bacterium]
MDHKNARAAFFHRWCSRFLLLRLARLHLTPLFLRSGQLVKFIWIAFSDAALLAAQIKNCVAAEGDGKSAGGQQRKFPAVLPPTVESPQFFQAK